ncbi:MAG: hypothetical protein ACI4E0_06380 [Blautia sp.]
MEKFRVNDAGSYNLCLQVVIADYEIPKGAQYLRSVAGNEYYQFEDIEISVYCLPASDISLMWLIMEPGPLRTLYISPSAGEEHYSMHELLKHMELINMLLEHDVWVLHCCYVKTLQGAILFTGNSGIGKSTQGQLWEQYGQGEVINGDRCVIYREDDRYMANGFVYSGSSGICKNKAAPVRAIVILNQNSNNKVRSVRASKAIRTLYLQTVSCPYRVRENDRKLKFAEQLYEGVEIVQLDCRPDEGAVRVLQEYLWK